MLTNKLHKTLEPHTYLYVGYINKSIRKIALITLFLISNSALACIAKQMPVSDLDKYDQIFIAEVTGVHLVEYEKDRLKSLSQGKNQRWFTDLTQEQHLTILVTKIFSGEPARKLEVKVGGCGVVTPSPLMYGIFFVDKQKNQIIPIYENEGEIYYELLIKLGKKFAAQ